MATRRKPHNAFTNHEVALIREHWPTRMPMVELLALLPRHTENSITGYANKILGLRRSHIKNVKPAWNRVRRFLEERSAASQTEIAEALGFSRARASELMREHRSEVYVKTWRWPDGKGRAEMLWALGNEPDAPEPMGRQRAKRLRVRRINPFFAAAGLVRPPVGQSGRIYQQSMSINDEEQAA